jgi:sterol desaturase/sphingolipid hydroxylase (fatty acid hydroxylase superfamily)
VSTLTLSSAADVDALRHRALPAYYVATVTTLLAAAVTHDALPALTDALVVGTVVVGSSVMMALERLGASWFAQRMTGDAGRYLAAQVETLTREHTWTLRATLIAQAVACWFVVGIATVFAAHAAGAAVGVHVAGVSRWLASWPELARVTAAFVALDAWSYLRHRAEHARGERNALWRLVHRRHHEPTAMNLWTGMIVHPVEAVLVFALPTLAMGALGYARWECTLLFALFLVITMPQHMNSGWTAGPFSAWIHGPEAHTAHHSADIEARNANYADCLTVWDRLFGTYRPTTREVFRGPFGP